MGGSPVKETVVRVDGLLSVMSARGVEKHLSRHPGIHRIEANFMNGTATVAFDEAVITLAEIKRLIAECGYHCAGEATPKHVCHPGDPPADAALRAPAVHAHAPAPPAVDEAHVHAPMRPTEHAAHAHGVSAPKAPAAEMAGMEHAGHGGMSMEEMARDMGRRFWAAFILSIPITLYSPLATEVLGLRLPAPFGIDVKLMLFALTTPVVFYST